MENDLLRTIELKNSKGMEMVVSNYGATIISLKVPDKHNDLQNVVVGLNEVNSYTTNTYQSHGLYLGCMIGRYAGRISKGYVEIEGEKYPVHNEDGVHLHGGKRGFDKRYWSIEKTNSNSVVLNYTSSHLEEGYPGTLKVQLSYELTESNALKIISTATTDRPTVLNLTNHSYFNLNGSATILDHQLQICSDCYLEFDHLTLPTGRLLDTKNTQFDYNEMTQLREANFKGLDDIFVLRNSAWAARLKSKKSGIVMKVSTNQPAVVVYTPKNLPQLNYSDGVKFGRFPAICFETQNFADAPHNNNFPSSLLMPNEVYKNESTFDFSTEEN